MTIDRHYYSDNEIRRMVNSIQETEKKIRNRMYQVDLQEVENMAKCQGCRLLFVKPRSKVNDGMIESVYQMPICVKGHHKCCGEKVVQILHEEITEPVNMNA